MYSVKIRHHFKKSIPYIATVFLTASAIYFTPLKWITVIEPKINDIDPSVFNADFEKTPSKYVFIDVRPEDAYRLVHAKGSINMPLHTLYDQRLILPKHGKQIVLICSGGRASGIGYSYLQHYGFFNINRIEGGIELWIAEGLPLEGSAIPKGPTTTISVNYDIVPCV